MAHQDPNVAKIRLRFPDRARFARVWERELRKGGLFLKSPKTQPIGTPVRLELLPADVPAPLVLQGQVIHSVTVEESEASGQPPGIGVRFTPHDPLLVEAVDGYCQGLQDDFTPRAPEPEPEPEPEPAWGAAPDPGYGDHAQLGGDVSPEAPGASHRSLTPVGPAQSPGAPTRVPDAVGAEPTPEPEPVPEPAGPDPELIASFHADLEAIEGRLGKDSDFYKLLKVDPDCSPTDIKEAFTELKKQCHPDRFQARGTSDVVDRATRVYEEVNKAYVTLSAPQRRAAYNIMLGRYQARYQTDEEEQAHRLVAGEFRRNYVDKFPAKVRKAEMFASAAKTQIQQDRTKGARNNLRLALSFDPLNDEYRALLIDLERTDGM